MHSPLGALLLWASLAAHAMDDPVFLAHKVPAFSARRFRVEAGAALARDSVKAEADTLVHPEVTIRIDGKTGAVVSLPSDDGKAWIVRLFGASGKTDKVKLAWTRPAPRQVWLSDTSEQPRDRTGSAVEVPGWGIVTLRAE